MEEFRKLAAVEDRMWYFRVLHEHLFREIVRATGPGPKSLIDAGCGTGGWLRRLRTWAPDWRCAGFDPSSEALSLAQMAGTQDVKLGSLAAPPALPPADAVTCADVLYMVPDLDEALQNLRGLVRPGGVVVMTGPAYTWLHSYHDEAVGGIRRFTLGGLSASARRAGLEPVGGTYWNSLLLPVIFLRRKVFRPALEKGDVQLGSPLVEALLRGVGGVEAGVCRLGVRWPCGANVLLAARRV